MRDWLEFKPSPPPMTAIVDNITLTRRGRGSCSAADFVIEVSEA